MTIRTTLANTTRMARTAGGSRGTVRDFDDKHLLQEIKEVDVFHSETHSQVERFQSVGLTSVPLKQQKSTTQNEQSDDQSGWNHNQPTGPAAEAVISYLNGSRSHAVAFVDDRRVRPYGMKEGEGAHYAPDGSEQMSFVNESGYHVVSLDGPSVKDPDTKKTRYASLRHVNKKMQSHDGEKVAQEQDYKHEGDSVNTEVRVTAGRIEFRAGNTVVGYYDASAETWYFKGKIAQMEFSQKVETAAPTISNSAATRFETVGPTYLGIDSKGEGAPAGERTDIAYKQTYVKLIG